MYRTVILEHPIGREELKKIAEGGFGDMVKAVVDVENGILAISGELHVDIQAILMEKRGSLNSSIWGINLYPEKQGEDFIEFDSMVNLKPQYGNRTRDIQDQEIREKIRDIVKIFII